MNRIEELNHCYAACQRVARDGVEIVAVGDQAGARFNADVRQLVTFVRDEGGSFLDELVGAAKALRWRRIFQPQPLAFNRGLRELAAEVDRHASSLQGAMEDQTLLDELAFSANELAESDSEVASMLLASIDEVGPENCVVVAASKAAASGIEAWLAGRDVSVCTAGEMTRAKVGRDQAYVVGPPRFHSSSLVTAPVTEAVSFLVPAWFGDRSVRRSALAEYAERSIPVKARVFEVGDTSHPGPESPGSAEDENEFRPHPMWGNREESDREPASDEVQARKVLISGNLAIWLDVDSEIRTLEPGQPEGERVTYTHVSAVGPDTYLLLRSGETDRKALSREAISRLRDGEAIVGTQKAWKSLLAQRICEAGPHQVKRRLSDLGVRSAGRATAWVDPELIRPELDQDFEKLLAWLGIPIQPTYDNAIRLRREIRAVSADIRKQLESAASAVNLSTLEATGHLSLDVETEGFRGIFAARVLAVSRFTTVVARNCERVPFEDRGGRWLE